MSSLGWSLILRFSMAPCGSTSSTLCLSVALGASWVWVVVLGVGSGSGEEGGALIKSRGEMHRKCCRWLERRRDTSLGTLGNACCVDRGMGSSCGLEWVITQTQAPWQCTLIGHFIAQGGYEADFMPVVGCWVQGALSQVHRSGAAYAEPDSNARAEGFKVR